MTVVLAQLCEVEARETDRLSLDGTAKMDGWVYDT